MSQNTKRDREEDATVTENQLCVIAKKKKDENLRTTLLRAGALFGGEKRWGIEEGYSELPPDALPLNVYFDPAKIDDYDEQLPSEKLFSERLKLATLDDIYEWFKDVAEKNVSLYRICHLEIGDEMFGSMCPACDSSCGEFFPADEDFFLCNLCWRKICIKCYESSRCYIRHKENTEKQNIVADYFYSNDVRCDAPDCGVIVKNTPGTWLFSPNDDLHYCPKHMNAFKGYDKKKRLLTFPSPIAEKCQDPLGSMLEWVPVIMDTDEYHCVFYNICRTSKNYHKIALSAIDTLGRIGIFLKNDTQKLYELVGEFNASPIIREMNFFKFPTSFV